MSVEEYMVAARVKVPYLLIEGETILLDGSSSPFGEGKLPIMCESLGEEIQARLRQWEAFDRPPQRQWVV